MKKILPFVFLTVGIAFVSSSLVVQSARAVQTYEPYIEILEGSVKCRQGIFGSSGPMLSYEAWLTDPNGTTIATHSKWSYTYRLDGEYSVEPAVDGSYTCHADLYVDGTRIASLTQSKNIVVQTPTSLNNYYEAYVSGNCGGGLTTRYWKVRDYQVLDQQSPPQPIHKTMNQQESFVTNTNTCGSTFATGGGNTTSQGTFRETISIFAGLCQRATTEATVASIAHKR